MYFCFTLASVNNSHNTSVVKLLDPTMSCMNGSNSPLIGWHEYGSSVDEYIVFFFMFRCNALSAEYHFMDRTSEKVGRTEK